MLRCSRDSCFHFLQHERRRRPWRLSQLPPRLSVTETKSRCGAGGGGGYMAVAAPRAPRAGDVRRSGSDPGPEPGADHTRGQPSQRREHPAHPAAPPVRAGPAAAPHCACAPTSLPRARSRLRSQRGAFPGRGLRGGRAGRTVRRFRCLRPLELRAGLPGALRSGRARGR